MLDDKLLFTAGARHQKVVIRGYNKITGAENDADGFDGSRWMPTYGVVYKPWEEISLYANHTEALQPGETAPRSANNYGQSTGIVHSKQNEVGVKADFGRVGGSWHCLRSKCRRPSSTTAATTAWTLNSVTVAWS